MNPSNLESQELSDPAPIMRIALLIIAIITFWVGYILVFEVKCIYGVPEVAAFRKFGFSDIFGMMDFGKYKRFSPVGFGLWGYLDIHFLVPILGKAGAADAILAEANRLLWVHLAFLGLLCASSAFVSWRLFQHSIVTTLVVLLVGLNDAIPFQFRFASTVLCYQLQIATLFTIYFVVVRERTWVTFFGAAGCIAFILLTWEQGLNLAIATSAYLGILILRQFREKGVFPRWDVFLFMSIALMMTIYLVARVQGGTEESLSSNNEASFFFSYKNPFLMFDDLLLNFSALVEQSIRQIFPFPFESFSVLLGKDMNQFNPYNLSYSQFPNMPYRMMGLWFSGLSFSLFWVFLAATIYSTRKSGRENAALLLLCIFGFGFALHLPVMHRDYFYIPGYAVGYKVSVSYVGFVFMIGLLAERVNWHAAVRILGFRPVSLVYGYVIAAAILRAIALTQPQRFPW